ncbi:hypothetical protein FLL45_05615 [Aliikangiella marina]|uniref:KfrA N-terminal DNA-binding domain-containing protein n=1 Tax=Aliikangiella marina TaxID=1712262 RepID=A0A545TJT5_9GAMM|nr:DNA-binding protein [Aliikangiella marina]TQV77421.1 hypothetical protein FLL45_05615 [Aliikangiella marina]
MARIGVTLEDVSDAAARLLLDGKSPTVALVREYLGTGSNTTISRHLKSWRANNHKRSKNLLSDKMPEKLIPTFESLWNTALSEAETSFRERQEEWQKSQQALQSMTDDFETELNFALKANDDLKQEVDQLRRLRKQGSAELANLSAEYEELKSDYRQYKLAMTKKIKALKAEIERLK